MREKYESLSLATLKDLAKARGLKGISTMRKPELIERMLEEDKKEAADTVQVSSEKQEPAAASENEKSDTTYVKSRTIVRRNPEYRSNYSRNENTGRQGSYNGENRQENYVKRTTVAKAVEVVPPAELKAEVQEQPRTANENANQADDSGNPYNVSAEAIQLDSGEKANGILEVMPDGF